MRNHHDKREAKKPRQTSEDAPSRAIQYVQDSRGRALTLEERLDILSLHASFRKDESAVPRKQSVTNKISRLLLRSNKTVGNVWSDFTEHDAVFISDVPANRSDRPTRILRSVNMLTAVRSFIRTRCETRIRTTAKDVMHFLVEESFLCVDMTDQVQLKTVLRQVQRFLKDAGYSRGEHKAAVLKLPPQNGLRRAECVLRMACGDDKRRVVYMDESYIHQHYARHNDSLFDPSGESSVKPKHKGRRLCFIAAIIAQDQSVRDEDRVPQQRAGLLGETANIFEGGKQTKDYHGMFCHDYFVQWMEKLLRCLKNRCLSNCLIVMDNAKYHKPLPASVPKKGNKKEVLISVCQQYGTVVPPNASKPILWELLSSHIEKSVVSAVEEMAQQEGHEVVYTPPHHPDLQPVEIIWAIVKGEVRRQYTTGTTFDDIQTRLDAAFQNLQSSTVQGCIDAANQQLFELKKHLDTMDGQNKSSSDDEELEPDSGLD